ncbi:MAG TPA: isocitrate lyase/phosphoenolpyruvate mutase family protein [Kofleriaceae bacterium]|jgi:2-methylisocitrate lyase-like PEP mutase family enzyme
MTVEGNRARFRQLHQAGCFVLPNPWDVGSARMLQSLGFAALATTSAGFAWSTGLPDYAVTLDGVLEHLRTLCASVDVPINADFESGFARDPEAVAHNVGAAVETGLAGLSIEDRDVVAPFELFDTRFAVERLRAAHAEIRRRDANVILVARTEGLLRDATAVSASIDKLVAFADAGADCLYAPGVTAAADIAAMVRAVAPKPLNVLVLRAGPSVRELADLGVRRISVGGGLARVAWGAMASAAKQMLSGSFDGLANGLPGSELNQIFGAFAGR